MKKEYLLLVVLLGLILSCSSLTKKDKLLLGKWHLIGFTLQGKAQKIIKNECTAKNYVQYMAGGKAVALRYEKINLNCKLKDEVLYDYQIKNDTTVSVTVNAVSTSYTYSIKGDTLIIKNKYLTQIYKILK